MHYDMVELKYTAVIRTLGTAGAKYQTLLDSLAAQTIKPEAILVYIAEGYPLPKETIGIEQYIYVKKGMVAQRALQYKEVKTEYVLFLDDDVYLSPQSVEILYSELRKNAGQVISPCTFQNHMVRLGHKILLSIQGRELCRFWRSRWGYKILWNGGFSYNNNPIASVYESQINAGPCFLCRKEDFLSIHYEDELWLDKTYYAFPEDQVMFYKMYCYGLKILTSFDSGVIHLDASSTVLDTNEKMMKIVFSEYRNKLIFWHRFLFRPEPIFFVKVLKCVSILSSYLFEGVKYGVYMLFGRYTKGKAFFSGVFDALCYIRSDEYKRLPAVFIKEK